MTNKEISCGIILYRYQKLNRQFLLVQHENGGHFGFPKGHVEKGETRKQTAIREVKEETNLDAVILGNYYEKVTYAPYPNAIKDVIYYIGKVFDGHLVKQDVEIMQTNWINEYDVLNYLKYDNDKNIFKNSVKKINRLDKGIDIHLLSYVEEYIAPLYNHLDDAHQADHVYQVIHDCFNYAKGYDVDYNMLYTIAAYHDLGLKFGRKTHHITSGDILREDAFIKSFFNEDQIRIMVDAIFDHRASNEGEPRTIYGKIIAEADRLLDAKQVIHRIAVYENSTHKDLPIDEKLKNCYDHLVEKYGEDGYLKLYLYQGKNVKELKKLNILAKDEIKMKYRFRQIINKLNK